MYVMCVIIYKNIGNINVMTIILVMCVCNINNINIIINV